MELILTKMKIQFYTHENINSLINQRDGETKWGENFHYFNPEIPLSDTPGNFVLFGIPEDLGVIGNYGVPGARNAWSNLLATLVNVQENRFLSGSEVLLLGHIICDDLLSEYGASPSIEKARELVEAVDQRVCEVVQKIVEANKIPIAIGGGHNNSYPLLKGTSQALQKAISAINLDPHADFRPLEGRHSGNGFSYAKHEGFLKDYYMLGLHQNYNSEAMLESLFGYADFQLAFHDHWMQGKGNLESSIFTMLDNLPEHAYWVELDLDAIEYMPTSAITPSGVSLNDARLYIRSVSKYKNAKYLHLPEGKPGDELSSKMLAKATTYLITDFIKAKILAR